MNRSLKYIKQFMKQELSRFPLYRISIYCIAINTNMLNNVKNNCKCKNILNMKGYLFIISITLY